MNLIIIFFFVFKHFENVNNIIIYWHYLYLSLRINHYIVIHALVLI